MAYQGGWAQTQSFVLVKLRKPSHRSSLKGIASLIAVPEVNDSTFFFIVGGLSYARGLEVAHSGWSGSLCLL